MVVVIPRHPADVERGQGLRPARLAHPESGLPGLQEPGQPLEKGNPLLVLEAMKMEHTIVAPRTGKVVRFHVAAGDQVSEGAELVEFEDSAT